VTTPTLEGTTAFGATAGYDAGKIVAASDAATGELASLAQALATIRDPQRVGDNADDDYAGDRQGPIMEYIEGQEHDDADDDGCSDQNS
jgi:hypothetical protein